MGIQLPEDLRDIMEMVGVDWPDIDEDQLTDTAQEYREFAEELRDTIRDANKACSNVLAGRSKGLAVDAFRQRWGKVSGQDMKHLADAMDLLAGAMDTGAGYVTTCKIAVIADLSAAAAVAGGLIGAIFTGGLSALLGAGAALALKMAVREAIDLLVSQLIDLAVEKIEGEILTKLEGLFDDTTSSQGHDKNGALLPEGLDSVGQDLWIEFAEFADAIDQLGKEQGKLHDKKKNFKDNRSKRSLVTKKDDRFAKFGAAIDKAEDKVEATAHSMHKEIEKNVTGLDKTKRSNDETDKHVKGEVDACSPGKKDDDGKDVPMYLLSKDGTVQQLLPDGTLKDVDKKDTSGIHDLLESGGKAWRPESRAEKREVGVQDDEKSSHQAASTRTRIHWGRRRNSPATPTMTTRRSIITPQEDILTPRTRTKNSSSSAEATAACTPNASSDILSSVEANKTGSTKYSPNGRHAKNATAAATHGSPNTSGQTPK
nr:hypothetical protein [Streptomyces sp. NRRL S-325]